jgi:YD repeat-containing protein
VRPLAWRAHLSRVGRGTVVRRSAHDPSPSRTRVVPSPISVAASSNVRCARPGLTVIAIWRSPWVCPSVLGRLTCSKNSPPSSAPPTKPSAGAGLHRKEERREQHHLPTRHGPPWLGAPRRQRCNWCSRRAGGLRRVGARRVREWRPNSPVRLACSATATTAIGSSHTSCSRMAPSVGTTSLRRPGTSLGTAAFSTTTYDTDTAAPGFGDLTGIRAGTTTGSSNLFQTSYTRDALGRISTLVETVQGQRRERRYVYDDAGRLVEVRDGGRG